MVKRSQKSKVKSQKSKIQLFDFSTLRLSFLLGLFLCLSLATSHSPLLFGQQPQAQEGQPLHVVDAKNVNGVAPGYWPSAATGLTLSLSTGTALCGNPLAPVTYTGGRLTMTAAATNYVYLDPSGSCVPASNTSGFDVGQIPIAVVATNGSTITAVNDVRSFFSPPITLDSTGRSIFRGLNGTYFADQLGNKSTTGIASAISACGTSTPCQVVVPGSYPTMERVPGSFVAGAGGVLTPGTTSSNVQVQDFRYGDYQTAFNQQGASLGDRPWHQWVENFYTPAPPNAYQNHTVFEPVMNALDGGVNLENNDFSYYKKSAPSAINAIINNYTPGDPGNHFINNQYSVGDSFPVYAIDYFYGGWATQGEEGAEGVDIWVMQGSTAYQATIASTGDLTGATRLTMNTPTAGAGTQGARRYLIDTTSGKTISAGTINSIANNTNYGTPVTFNFAGTGSSWSASTVNTTTTGQIISSGVHTVGVASTAGITTSTVLVICDQSAYETIIPTAVGPGTQFTANFAYPHSTGAIVAAGGLAGYFLELTADTLPSGTSAINGGKTATALRQAWPVLYSTSSSSLVASIDGQGKWRPFRPGQETACVPASGCGYVLYPGATVTSVYSSNAVGNTFSLMPNTVSWANGDTVEETQYPAENSKLGSWDVQSWWPSGSSWGANINLFGVQGLAARGMVITNSTPVTNYIGDTPTPGNLYPPYAAFRVSGAWGGLTQFSGYGPNVTGTYFNGQTWGSPGHVDPFIIQPSSGKADFLRYDETNKYWQWTVNSGAGSYYFGDNVSPSDNGGFRIPGHIGSASSDTQGQVSITSSTSATVDFSVAFQHAPLCTLTPTSDPTSVGAYWVTSVPSSLTVHVHTSGTITFNYVCMGNPN